MKKYFMLAAVATMFAACTNNDEPALQQNTPITVTASIGGLNSRAAGYSNSNLPATFYLSIDQEGTNYDYTNIEMTKGTDNNYTPATTLVWASDNREGITIRAYTVNTTAVSVNTAQNEDGNCTASDLLGAVVTTGSETTEEPDITISDDSGINIQFNHLLSKLDVEFTWGTEYDGKVKSITSVTLKNFAQAGSLNVENATVSGSSVADITALLPTPAQGENATAEAIFVPFTPVSDATPQLLINATVGGEDKIFTVDITAPSGGFLAGNAYTLGVKMGGTAVGSVTTTIGGWGTGESNNLGTNESESN